MKIEKSDRAFFTNDAEVKSIIQKLKSECGEICEHRHISDVYDEEGHPYVNLVQEGGGVLGVALVGYTYALESVGIRFLKLAGTSAGAINTLLLATVVPNGSTSTKSEKILDYLAKKPLFDFVDAHWLVRPIIKALIKTQHTLRRIKWYGLILLSLAIVGPVMATIIRPTLSSLLQNVTTLNKASLWAQRVASVFLRLGVFAEAILLLILALGIYLWKRFRNGRWGIAKGDAFRNWSNSILRDEIANPVRPGIISIEDFENHVIAQAPKDLWLAPEYFKGLPSEEGYPSDWGRGFVEDLMNPSFSANPGWVTFITSDITTRNKIELPRMWPLYRLQKNQLEIADFVRASMSIPIFFSIHKISGIPNSPLIRSHWESKDYLSYPKERPVPSEVCFVDGGTLSNFPINIFFNSGVTKPRLPTFGIRLGEDKQINQRFLSVGKYLNSLLGTIRFHYDKDFQLKHADFLKSTTILKVDKFNWLNFNLTDEEKLELFRIGVRAAYDFLISTDPREPGFNFTTIQKDRPALIAKLQETA